MFVSMTVGAMFSHLIAAFVIGAAVSGAVVYAVVNGKKVAVTA